MFRRMISLHYALCSFAYPRSQRWSYSSQIGHKKLDLDNSKGFSILVFRARSLQRRFSRKKPGEHRMEQSCVF